MCRRLNACFICVQYHSRFRRYPPITTVEENENFCNFVTTLLSEQLRGLYLCFFSTDIMTVHRSFQICHWAYLYLLPISAPISWILLCVVCLYPGYLDEFWRSTILPCQKHLWGAGGRRMGNHTSASYSQALMSRNALSDALNY